jgi:hypothetical protein
MTAHVQLFEASTAYQVMVLAAAIDSGLFAEADERILLVAVNTPIPEVAGRPDRAPGIAPLLSRFDRVVSLNDLLAPLHPTAFRPRVGEQPLLARLLLTALGVDEGAALELVVESVQAPPSRSLMNVFATAEVTVYAEGLMSYGPTRDPLPVEAASRIGRLLHLDLIEGLRPLLLTEWQVEAVAIPDDAFRAVVAEVRDAAPPALPEGAYALVLGQYLAQAGLLSRQQETALYAGLARTAAERGFATVAFKPHPSAPSESVEAVERSVRDLGVRFEVLRDPTPVEALYAASAPGLVLGCFSTGLVTGARYWGVPAVTAGTADVLASLPRFEDSNRIPLALVEQAFPDQDGGRAVDLDTLQLVAETVGYCMQWRHRGRWRPEAEAALRDRPDLFAHTIPVAKRRLLGLPGGLPVAVPAPVFERASGTAERAWAARTAIRRRLGR